MKPQETFLACLLLSGVAGAVAAVTTSLVLEPSGRADEVAAQSAPVPAGSGAEALAQQIEGLRAENVALQQRIDELETRISTSLTARTPVADVRPVEAERTATAAESGAAAAAALGGDGNALNPAFVASVDQALGVIRAREEKEREDKRKQIQAERVEERLAKLRDELGLASYQVNDMRTALLTQDEKREALFSSMKDGGDRRVMFEGMRTIRDETYTSLQGILTADQFAHYKESDEGDFGRRGFGQGRGPDGPPDGAFGGGPPGGR